MTSGCKFERAVVKQTFEDRHENTADASQWKYSPGYSV